MAIKRRDFLIGCAGALSANPLALRVIKKRGKIAACGLFIAALSYGALAVPPRAAVVAEQEQRVNFARDIQPIFEQNCTSCHGAKKAAGQLRLDVKSSALKGGISGPVIVPGSSKDSRLVHRILGEGGEQRMPFNMPPLSEQQILLISRWIDEGAPWPDENGDAPRTQGSPPRHWAFIKPSRPVLPALKDPTRVRTPVDNFVLARLEKEGLKPAPEADRATLLRRVSLDLTGLPPTMAELDAFLNDPSANAYEKIVDRLLSSPRYGERMAFPWLDAARYADTNGYQIDGERSMWRWRDWVVEAFNSNRRYDQFVIDQLAGDLLPNATLEQQIATAFNRNHRINAEGGIVPEEYRIEYVVDRVDTSATVFMGLTLGCARCHNHKYDPLTQKEYYQLSAYFNSIDEDGHSFDQGNSPPWMVAPTREQQQRLQQFDHDIARAESSYTTLAAKTATLQRRWEKSLLDAAQEQTDRHWFPEEGLIVRLAMDEHGAPVFNKSEREHHEQYERKENDPDPKFEIGFRDGAPRYVPAPTGQGVAFDGKLYFDGGIHADFRYKSTSKDYRERFTIAAWIYPETEQSGSVVTKVSDSPADVENNVPRAVGYGMYFVNGKIHFNMNFRWGEDALRVETANPLPLRQWHHVAVVFDGLQAWEERIRIYVNGREQGLQFNQRNFFLLFGNTKDTLKIGAGGGPQFRFKGALDEVRLYSRALNAGEIGALACPDALAKIAALLPSKRTPPQAMKIHRAYLASAAPAGLKSAYRSLMELKEQRQKFADELPRLMVMKEMPKPRPAFLLRRGAYDAPGERVERAVPAVLPPLLKEYPRNRLGLAQWLVSPDHPLTSRVAVNRFWQMLFGAGLVKTSEDFGTQGEPPAHPELLDWLAVEFRNSGWDVKRLLKTIVMSATYRQSSKVTQEIRQRDPDNRLLARGPRLRLTAEMIRDQALFVSGLLVERVGGPSVKPYQPEGIYKDMTFAGLGGYERERGEGLWRRSLYTYWKRTVLAPAMQVFDASAREACVVRETRTNTPLQSLNLMNDVTYIEAARMLAQRMITEGGVTPQQRLAWAFRAATSRHASEEELQVLLRNLINQSEYYSSNPQAAIDLLSVGDKRNDAKLNQTELAAYAVTASLILNLDEVIVKQ
jgi:mono/diheme cytochrome c family protein